MTRADEWIKTAQQDRLTGFVLACLIHLGLFFLGGKVFVQPPHYGVRTGDGGVEVNLIAALPVARAEEMKTPPPAQVKQEESPKKEMPEMREKDAMVLPEAAKEKTTAVVPAAPRVYGDGSSPVPGKDATTAHARGGARVQGNSTSYFQNPAPPYPELARQLKQEGLVMLVVDVDRQGRPVKVEIERSSGYRLLDQAAVEAVKRWKFEPARVGDLTIESKAKVPIRFRLEE